MLAQLPISIFPQEWFRLEFSCADPGKVLRDNSTRFLEAAKPTESAMCEGDHRSSEQPSDGQREEGESKGTGQQRRDQVARCHRRNYGPQLRNEIAEGDREFPAQIR